jgi:hypothetical protein
MRLNQIDDRSQPKADMALRHIERKAVIGCGHDWINVSIRK